MGRWWPAAGLGALSAAVHAWDLSREVTIIFINSTKVWPQVNSREGTQLHESTANWIKDLLSMAPPIRTRPSFPLSLFPQEASISLLFFSIEGRQTENHNHRKLTNLITWTTVQFSHSVMSESLRPHGLQHARLSCPLSFPRACSISCH